MLRAIFYVLSSFLSIPYFMMAGQHEDIFPLGFIIVPMVLLVLETNATHAGAVRFCKRGYVLFCFRKLFSSGENKAVRYALCSFWIMIIGLSAPIIINIMHIALRNNDTMVRMYNIRFVPLLLAILATCFVSANIVKQLKLHAEK